MKKIVVVDDQPVLASIYRAKFLAEGFNVDVAADGEAALELIERVKPDVVLLDLMLPKIKGIDCT
jgi:two-component system response regulator VicR